MQMLRVAEDARLGSTGAISGTRRFVVRSYILTYRYRDGAVEITAIRHSRQADAHEPQEAFEIDAPPDENDGDPAAPRPSR
jgi:plasmid stabilization system protein ParE